MTLQNYEIGITKLLHHYFNTMKTKNDIAFLGASINCLLENWKDFLRSLLSRRREPCDILTDYLSPSFNYLSHPFNFITPPPPTTYPPPSFLLLCGYLLLPVIVRSVFDRCSIGVRSVFDSTLHQSILNRYRIYSGTGAAVRIVKGSEDVGSVVVREWMVSSGGRTLDVSSADIFSLQQKSRHVLKKPY